MLLSVLTEKLKINVQDDTLEWGLLRRCFERAVVQLNHDLSTSYVIDGADALDTTILPDPSVFHQELLLILAEYNLVNSGRLSASNAFSWQSGDKRVDKSRTALSKKEYLVDLWNNYLQLAGLDTEAVVIGSQYESTGGDDDLDWDRNRSWVS